MVVPVEEAIVALSTFSLEDEQAEVQGPGIWVLTERGAIESPIEYNDVSAYRLSLSEDTKALNQLVLCCLYHHSFQKILNCFGQIRCNFTNFARNICCLKCKAEGPKKSGGSDIEMKKGLCCHSMVLCSRTLWVNFSQKTDALQG
ncbi:uncharacterized protein LOC133777943 isoform X2 [Humulus lupulus]|uniref:uncharacterized protein LOC133777943 isoform X2 n=1 Tax=Humulus lupulus TaxID=3486 RepID=UPI002B41687F|nr:uncharacterized protein LOC133777943 isoform X2 [Humulus lupulus]